MSLNFSSSGQTKQIKQNQEIALIFYSLAFSDRGKLNLKRSFKLYSKTLIQKFEAFLLNLKKKGYFKEETKEEAKQKKELSKNLGKALFQKDAENKTYTESQIRKIIDDFIDKIQNITDADIDKIKHNIKENYFIGNILLIEGFILGFYDYLRNFFSVYYELIDIQYQSEIETQVGKEIFNLIPKNIITSKIELEKLLGKWIPNKLQDYEKKTGNVQKEIEVNKNNTEVLQNFARLNYKNLNILKNLTHAEKEPKKYTNLIAKITKIEKNNETIAEASKTDFDNEIFKLIESIMNSLLDLRKKVINKNLYKQLTGVYDDNASNLEFKALYERLRIRTYYMDMHSFTSNEIRIYSKDRYSIWIKYFEPSYGLTIYSEINSKFLYKDKYFKTTKRIYAIIDAIIPSDFALDPRLIPLIKEKERKAQEEAKKKEDNPFIY